MNVICLAPLLERVFYVQNCLTQTPEILGAAMCGPLGKGKTMIGLIYAVAMVFFVLWVVGFLFVHVGGGLIHILLVLAIIAIVYNLLTGRRAV